MKRHASSSEGRTSAILDTVILFATADSNDKQHERAKRHLQRIGEPEVYLGAFALFEFDITLKSRGFTFEERMEKHALLLRDHPTLEGKIAKLNPSTFYMTSRLEEETELEYFDADIDGSVVSSDRAFDKVEGLTRAW
jgi:predicted nucleic acid-binding protein